jgi:nucleoside-diphosphate-sugar epimerase
MGASGYIGERIVSALAASDWATPLAASRGGARRAGANLESLRLDVRDAPAVRNALRGVAGVVNCVAGDDDSIVAGARVLFAACKDQQPQPRIVHLSTMQVYGTAHGMVEESAPLRGDWDGYSAAKVVAEEHARTCASVVVLRPGIVYGPGSPIWSVAVGRWLRAGRLGELGPAGEGICNLVHVDDVVEAVLRALRLPDIAGAAFNLSLPAPPTWNAYFRQYAAALGVPPLRMSPAHVRFETAVRAPVLKAGELLARAARLQWRPAPPLRPWFLRLCGQQLQLATGRAERVLGLRWKPLEQGLAEAAQALRSARTGT